MTVPTRPLTASHPVHWFAPQPLWRVLPRDADFTTRRGQPAILRFASDSFMDDLLALLGTAPLGDLAAYVAQPESWREPLVGLKDGRDRSQELLKLYQPAHNRFYLVAGALACAVPGVPDRMIEPNQGESAFFVIRRRRPKPGTSGQTLEDAWSTGMQLCADAPAKGWVELADADHELLCNEERLPLFPISFQQDGVTRRRLAGLVPVASREAAAAAAPSAAERAKPGGDPRPILFEQQITGVVQSLREWYIRLPKDSAGKPASDVDQRQLKRTTAFMLLDLMAQLRDHVRPLYDAINGGTLVTSGPAKPLSDLIGGTTASGTRLSEVMRAIEQDRAQIEALEADDPLKSSWEFPWSGWDGNFAAWMAPLESATLTIPQPGGGQRTETVHGPAVQVRFARALAQPFVPSGPAATYPPLPRRDPAGREVYVARLVYDRPRCGAPTISLPSRPFALASFFDPDAPVRPLRIALPVDTTTEGLRKYDKGVAFVLSDQLRAQMARVGGLNDLMAGKLNDSQGFDLGLICSFSIPIITICALILLMIIVQLLNIVFWWLPFFKICLPIGVSRK